MRTKQISILVEEENPKPFTCPFLHLLFSDWTRNACTVVDLWRSRPRFSQTLVSRGVLDREFRGEGWPKGLLQGLEQQGTTWSPTLYRVRGAILESHFHLDSCPNGVGNFTSLRKPRGPDLADLHTPLTNLGTLSLKRPRVWPRGSLLWGIGPTT